MKCDSWAREVFEMKVQAADNNEKTLTCMIVSNKTNRGRRKIDIDGCQTEDYMKSPVVLAFHDDERVIARCLRLKFQDDGIIAKFEFRDSELANDIFNLYKEGFLTSWSIGFLPVSWNYEEENGVEIIHITRWILLEVSAVSIPMDSNAITLAVGQGIVHDSYLIQSVKDFNYSGMLENILQSSVDSLKAITEFREGVRQQIECYIDKIDSLKEMVDVIQKKFDSLESLVGLVDEKIDLNEANTLVVQDMTDLSMECRRAVKGYLEKRRGVMR